MSHLEVLYYWWTLIVSAYYSFDKYMLIINKYILIDLSQSS